jgi:hypothetical protein
VPLSGLLVGVRQSEHGRWSEGFLLSKGVWTTIDVPGILEAFHSIGNVMGVLAGWQPRWSQPGGRVHAAHAATENLRQMARCEVLVQTAS